MANIVRKKAAITDEHAQRVRMEEERALQEKNWPLAYEMMKPGAVDSYVADVYTQPVRPISPSACPTPPALSEKEFLFLNRMKGIENRPQEFMKEYEERRLARKHDAEQGRVDRISDIKDRIQDIELRSDDYAMRKEDRQRELEAKRQEREYDRTLRMQDIEQDRADRMQDIKARRLAREQELSAFHEDRMHDLKLRAKDYDMRKSDRRRELEDKRQEREYDRKLRMQDYETRMKDYEARMNQAQQKQRLLSRQLETAIVARERPWWKFW